jgi:hypothetical protein
LGFLRFITTNTAAAIAAMARSTAMKTGCRIKAKKVGGWFGETVGLSAGETVGEGVGDGEGSGVANVMSIWCVLKWVVHHT